MKRRAIDVPALCDLQLSDDDVIMYTQVDEVCIQLKPYHGISVCKQLYERLFWGREGYSYDGFLSQIQISDKLRGHRRVYVIRTNDVIPDHIIDVHNPRVLWDPSSTWSRVLYDIDDVSDKFNDLADLKAVCALPKKFCDQPYPMALLPEHILPNVQDLGYLNMDIQKDGSVHVVPRGLPIRMPPLEKPLAILHFTMLNTVDQRIHSNVLLFIQDKDGKYTVERFESHGSDIGTKQRPNSVQVKCDFNAFYNSGAMDDVADAIAKGYGAVYLKPMPEFPLLGQSISNQSGEFNKGRVVGRALGFRRRDAHIQMGDPFCAAHTAYYMVLRLVNPELDRLAIYSYLHGPADLSLEQRGGRASDHIAHFILWVHNKFYTVLQSNAFAEALEQLGPE
jgi:hypothetical protein